MYRSYINFESITVFCLEMQIYVLNEGNVLTQKIWRRMFESLVHHTLLNFFNSVCVLSTYIHIDTYECCCRYSEEFVDELSVFCFKHICSIWVNNFRVLYIHRKLNICCYNRCCLLCTNNIYVRNLYLHEMLNCYYGIN